MRVPVDDPSRSRPGVLTTAERARSRWNPRADRGGGSIRDHEVSARRCSRRNHRSRCRGDTSATSTRTIEQTRRGTAGHQGRFRAVDKCARRRPYRDRGKRRGIRIPPAAIRTSTTAPSTHAPSSHLDRRPARRRRRPSRLRARCNTRPAACGADGRHSIRTSRRKTAGASALRSVLVWTGSRGRCRSPNGVLSLPSRRCESPRLKARHTVGEAEIVVAVGTAFDLSGRNQRRRREPGDGSVGPVFGHFRQSLHDPSEKPTTV